MSKATERPANHNTVKPLDQPAPDPKKLPLDLAREEQALRQKLEKVDIGRELNEVNALLKEASDAREAFLKRHGYVTRMAGSWEDTQYWEVHPLCICKWENDKVELINQWRKGVIPSYSLISY